MPGLGYRLYGAILRNTAMNENHRSIRCLVTVNASSANLNEDEVSFLDPVERISNDKRSKASSHGRVCSPVVFAIEFDRSAIT